MKKKTIQLNIRVFILTALLVCTAGNGSLAGAENRRDEKIFMSAANSIAAGKYVEAKVLLRTLIYTYPDSPLAEQFRLLVFYSIARDPTPKNDEARRILQQVERYLEINDPKPQDE